MLLEAWESKIEMAAQATILPDGCRDLLFRAIPGKAPQWEITSLDESAYRIEMQAGTYFKGFRLHAGASINTQRLLAAMQGVVPDDTGIEDRLQDFSWLDPLVADTLDALYAQTCPDGTVANAATSLGVHPRRLQRAMARHTGRSAAKWLALARVRKAARTIRQGENLAAVANDCGYADQPHMHRAFKQWLGTTPKFSPALSKGYG